MHCFKFFILSVSILLCSCPGKSTAPNSTLVTSAEQPSDANQQGPLRVRVWDDPQLGDVLEREWEARSSGAIELIHGNSSEWLAAGENRLEADVIVFPSSLLGHLAERRLIRVLPPELIDDVSYDKLGIYDVVRRREMMWGDKAFAVSFGSPVLMLLTRDDILAKESIPTTWTELGETVKRLRTEDNSRTPLLSPTSEGWPSKLLVARTAPYLFDRARMSTLFDFRSLEPRLHTAPFVRALQEMADVHTNTEPSITPGDVLRQFLDGEATMAITWPSAMAQVNQESRPPEFAISVTELPGANEYFDYGDETWRERKEIVRVTLAGTSGRMGAISRTGRNASLAALFLAWATGPEMSGIVCTRSTSTAPFRRGQKASPGSWTDQRIPVETAEEYTNVLDAALNQSNAWTSLRLPGQQGYLQVLDAAINDALRKTSTVQDALQKASSEWKRINEDVGLDSQLKAYRHSLNLQ